MGIKDTLSGIIKSVAPTIGTALGGPAGGIAVKFLAEKLLGKPEASADEVEKVLVNASPADLLKLKELDMQFAKDMKALDIDVFNIEVEDRKSARSMFSVNIWPQISLTALFTVGYFAVLIILLTGKVSIPTESQPVVNVVIGVLTAGMATILAFWFGSSLGSQQKTEQLSKIGGAK